MEKERIQYLLLSRSIVLLSIPLFLALMVVFTIWALVSYLVLLMNQLIHSLTNLPMRELCLLLLVAFFLAELSYEVVTLLLHPLSGNTLILPGTIYGKG